MSLLEIRSAGFLAVNPCINGIRKGRDSCAVTERVFLCHCISLIVHLPTLCAACSVCDEDLVQ